MGVTPIVQVANKDNTGKVVGTAIYTADSEGNILYCDTTGHVANWSMQGIFQLLTYPEPGGVEVGGTTWAPVAGDLPVVVPRAFLRGKDSTGKIWLFGGTADLMMPDSDLDGTRKLTNEQQYIFGINLTNAPSNAKLGDTQMKKWIYFDDGLAPSYGEPYPSDKKGDQGDPGEYGWVLRLRPKMSHPSNPRDAEYVTTAPYLAGGELYIATFVPHTRTSGQGKTCPEVGDAKLYIMNPRTGRSRLTNKNHIFLKNIKITGISVSGRRIYLGIQQQVNPNSWNEANDVDMKNKSLLAGGAVGVFEIEPEPSSDSLNITPDVPHLHYWRERIR
jgi:Tfp pilus tip-associated adhesin PilY1